MDRAQETAAVKRSLIRAGFDQNHVRVFHGKGTAYGWLKIHADIHRAPSCACGDPDQYGRREPCEPCKTAWRNIHNRIIEVALETTGRTGDYDGRIGLHLDFIEEVKP